MPNEDPSGSPSISPSAGLCSKDYDGYPECQSRIDWMRENWNVGDTYVNAGVDGTDCSMQRYLSHEGEYCPQCECWVHVGGNCVRQYADYPNCQWKMTWMHTDDNWKRDWYTGSGMDGSDCSIQRFLHRENPSDPDCPPCECDSSSPSPSATSPQTRSPSPSPNASRSGCSTDYTDYPECEWRMDWMQHNWDKPWYRSQGVDGSECSIQKYLHHENPSEPYCPPCECGDSPTPDPSFSPLRSPVSAPSASPSPSATVSPSPRASPVDCDQDYTDYSECAGRMDWMRAHWDDNDFYKAFGVDGTDCSIQKYLHEEAQWCPPCRCPSVSGSLCPVAYSNFPECHWRMTWMFANWDKYEWYRAAGVDGTHCSIQRFLHNERPSDPYCPSCACAAPPQHYSDATGFEGALSAHGVTIGQTPDPEKITDTAVLQQGTTTVGMYKSSGTSGELPVSPGSGATQYFKVWAEVPPPPPQSRAPAYGPATLFLTAAVIIQWHYRQ